MSEARSSHNVETVGPARRFRQSVLVELRRHGVVPRPGTSAELVRVFLRDLYTFRLRRLKEMHVEMERILGRQPIEPYRERVLSLKADYPLLTLPVRQWLEPDP